MKIAVINETSAADKNADILAALDGRGFEIINAGMTRNGAEPQLLYIHTGLMGAILLNLNRVDFIIGGCGTGQGFLNAVMQYPGVFCGHILGVLDAWLFTRINAGNCISLALNQGYGWAGEVNLKLIFDQIFSSERAAGYPPQKKINQKTARESLAGISSLAHRSFPEIMEILPENVVKPVLNYPGMRELINADSIQDPDLKRSFMKRF